MISKKARDFSNVDDNAVCVLRTESGIIGTLQASWSFYGTEDNSTVIYGEKGVLRLLNDDRHSFIFTGDRKSTRLNSSHVAISYAVFCLKKKTKSITSTLYNVTQPNHRDRG